MRRDELGVDVAERGEILEDHGDDEVDEHERGDDGEERQRQRRAAVAVRQRIRVATARLVDHRVGHECGPAVARQALEEQQHRRTERLEVDEVRERLKCTVR